MEKCFFAESDKEIDNISHKRLFSMKLEPVSSAQRLGRSSLALWEGKNIYLYLIAETLSFFNMLDLVCLI